MKHIFISSTFRDMQAERDLVQERVLPELKENARKYGENVGVIDLRWGVDTLELETDEGSRKVLSVCLDEIERSHPYMLIFMGERYGWIPNFSMIESAVKGKADKLVLDDYEKSITALEIEFGALSESYGELDKCVVCFRSPLTCLIKDEKERKIYLEENSKAAEKLQELQERMKKKFGNRIIEYTAEWNDNKKCFENFMTVQGEALEEVISAAYLTMFAKDWEAYANFSWQEREQLEVQAVMESKLKSFRGREKLLAQYRKLLEENSVLILQGEVGSGKTSIMCKLMQMLEDEEKHVFRFISGNTMNSSRVFDLVKQMVWFMEDMLGEKEHFEDIVDSELQIIGHGEGRKKRSKYDEWKEYFDLLCFRLPKDSEVYFCLDALDQMQKDEHVEKLDFLPRNHENIHLIASCTTEFEIPVTFSKEDRRVEPVPPLNVEDAMEVICGLSMANSKNVYESICTAMLEKKDSGNPLYLSFLMQCLNMMDQEKLRDAVSEQEIVATGVRVIHEVPQNLEDAAVYVVNEVIERLSEEKYVLREILNLMAVSRNGLRKEDFECILEKQGKVYPSLDMARLMKYLGEFFVSYSDGRIDFGHKVIRKGLREQLGNMLEWQQKILEHLKVLPDMDRLRNREGMYYARVLNEQIFAKELLLRAYKNENPELLKSIAEQALTDVGKFYGSILGQLTEEIESEHRLDIIGFFIDCFGVLLDLSKEEISTKHYCFEKLYRCCEDVYQNEQTSLSLFFLSRSNLCMGDVCEEQGHYAEAEKYYEKSLEYSEQIYKESGSLSSLSDLAVSTQRMGSVCMEQGHYAEAEKYCAKGLEYGEQTYKESRSLSSLRNFSIDNLVMGDVCMEQGRYAGAEKYYIKSLEYSEQIYKESGSLSSLRDLAVSNERMGYVSEEQGYYGKAEKYYAKDLEYSEQIHKESGSLSSLRDLATSNRKMGGICEKQKRYGDAKWYYGKGLKYSEQIHKESRSLSSLKDLATSNQVMGDVREELGHYDKAEKYYAKALAYAKQIHKESRNLKSLYELIGCYQRMGSVYEKRGCYIEAKKYYAKALEYGEQIHKESRSLNSLRALAISNQLMGSVCKKQGNYRVAEVYLHKAAMYHNEEIKIK